MAFGQKQLPETTVEKTTAEKANVGTRMECPRVADSVAKAETRAALDLICSDHLSRYEPGIFAPLRDALLTHGDHYMHLADLKSYLEADQRLTALYTDVNAWTRKAILNVAGSGKFSSDNTIAQYAAEIWRAKPCPVP
jgi:starch phosphorylase